MCLNSSRSLPGRSTKRTCYRFVHNSLTYKRKKRKIPGAEVKEGEGVVEVFGDKMGIRHLRTAVVECRICFFCALIFFLKKKETYTNKLPKE
jgi:hypothetical protein